MIRRALGTLLGPAGGIVTAGDLAVTQQATPNMSVLMGVGQCWVSGTQTATQGSYYGRNAAAVTLAIAAANVSNPRIDTIIVQVQDAEYSGSLKQMAPAVLTGTPTSGATLANLTGAATVPASSLVIAYVLVPAGATSIVTADIANVAAVVSNATGAWQPLTLTGGMTSAGLYTPSARLEGGRVFLKGTIVNATGSTIAANTNLFTVPVGCAPQSKPSAALSRRSSSTTPDSPLTAPAWPTVRRSASTASTTR